MTPFDLFVLVLFCVLMTAILTGMRPFLIVVWISVSLMISDIDYFVTYCVHSSPWPIFKTRLFFLLWNGRKSLCILEINPLSDIRFANISSHSVGCLFTLLVGMWNGAVTMENSMVVSQKN